MGDDALPVVLPQAQVGVHHLLVQGSRLVDDSVALGGGEPSAQHLGLLTRPVYGQVRLVVGQVGPGVREPLPPGQAGIAELVEAAAGQQLEIDDVVLVAQDPGGAQAGDSQRRGGARVRTYQGDGPVGSYDLANPGILHHHGAAAGAVDDERPGQVRGQGRQGRVSGIGQQVGSRSGGDVTGAQTPFPVDALDAHARGARAPVLGPGAAQPRDRAQRAQHAGHFWFLCHLSHPCRSRGFAHAHPVSFSGDWAMLSMTASSAPMRSRQDGSARRRGSASRARRERATATPSCSAQGTGRCSA